MQSDLPVDTIIERVMIRNTAQHYDYTRQKDQLTPSEHIWHYQLQEEKIALQEKLKKMRTQIDKKEEKLKKEGNLKKDIEQLKNKIEEVVGQNARIQKQLSRMRVRNSRESSGDLSRSRRECSCENRRKKYNCEEQISKRHEAERSKRDEAERTKRVESKLITSLQSPIKSILKTTKDVSTNCLINPISEGPSSLQQKKEHLQSLKAIVSHQQQLIASYQRELAAQASLDPKSALTSKQYNLQQQTSAKIFRAVSSVGSIIKIKRN